MIRFLMIVAACVVASASPVLADSMHGDSTQADHLLTAEESTQASQEARQMAAETLIARLTPIEQIGPMMKDMTDQMRALDPRARRMSASQWEDMSRVLNEEFVKQYPLLRVELAKLYARRFSVEELQGLLDFYSSPLGEKVVRAQTEITSESFALGLQWARTHLAPALERRLESELERTTLQP